MEENFRSLERNFLANTWDKELAAKLEHAIALSGEDLDSFFNTRLEGLAAYTKHMMLAYVDRVLPTWPQYHFGHTNGEWKEQSPPDNQAYGNTEEYLAIRVMKQGLIYAEAGLDDNTALYLLPELGLRRFPIRLYTHETFIEPQYIPCYDDMHEEVTDYFYFRTRTLEKIKACVEEFQKTGSHTVEDYTQHGRRLNIPADWPGQWPENFD